MEDMLQLSPAEITNRLRAGDRVMLARAITLIESTVPEHRQHAMHVLETCLPYTGTASRIGITGAPGVGKSTFIEKFGLYLVNTGKKLAVLAVDPSSRISKGSILGDKTRMQELARHKDVFVRPSAAGTQSGGIAAGTRECILLLEASGFDTILVETVGVGQSETAVYDMTDLFVLLLLPGAGDELQGIKRGIMEMADLILINKADGQNIDKAALAKAEVQRAIHLFQPKANGCATEVATVSSLDGKGIEAVHAILEKNFTTLRNSGFLQSNRQSQMRIWFHDLLTTALLKYMHTHRSTGESLTDFEQQIAQGKLLPPAAVEALLKRLLPS